MQRDLLIKFLLLNKTLEVLDQEFILVQTILFPVMNV